MDGWMDKKKLEVGWIEKRKNRWMVGWMDKKNGWLDDKKIWMVGWIKKIDGWLDG